MNSLPTALRRQLESACKQARSIAAIGARKALDALAVHEATPYGHMDEAQCKLRDHLLAQAKQLGDEESQIRPGAHEIKHLVEKLAYYQWHRLLFARYLLENNLLISPEHEVSVTLDDCEELAPSLGLKDAWAVAARFAAKELPQIFRADDSAGAVELPVEDRNPLIQLVTGMPVEVFTASDSLGWCYQFWQAERKDEVNNAGNKIGADELPAVTQLFTEDYMVDFLLDNTLGAWHAGKVLAAKLSLAETALDEEELRNAVALPGCPWRYLRFIKAASGRWTPAAGTFDDWPKAARELRCLDPCMGSGHFVVAMFERLVALLIAEGMLDETVAVEAVIRDNLFGLEIDPRCTQIAAFNLALAAWRRVGHCTLPPMNLACSGVAPNAKREDWLKLAGGNERLRNGMELLYGLFTDAPVLGSLINPHASEGDLLVAAFHELQPLVDKALAQEAKDDAAHEMAVTARGLAKAAEILAGQFTIIATNVPFLGRGKQDDTLKGYCERAHPTAKADLATCFVERSLEFTASNGSVALVTPQYWWFLGSYREMRASLLSKRTFRFLATLGEEAWQTFGNRGPVAVLMVIDNAQPSKSHSMLGVDALPYTSLPEKRLELLTGRLASLTQAGHYGNPDHRITISEGIQGPLLENFASSYLGLGTCDAPHYTRCFWEIPALTESWSCLQGGPGSGSSQGGREQIVAWDKSASSVLGMSDEERSQGNNQARGRSAWGRRGVAVSLIRTLRTAAYDGDLFEKSIAVLVPKQDNTLLAIRAFAESPAFNESVRRIDNKVMVTNATLVKVPFDLAHWQRIAVEKYPRGLPSPFSIDPTQWLFNGHPQGSDQPLHAAVARLLGYEWPRQTGSSFLDCPALGPDGLEELADHEGIVCLSAATGKAPAAERLRGLLVRELGKFDTRALIARAGPKGSKSERLEDWLQDEFFEQHCTLFQHRPFIWHIWDAHKTGFSALANYHKLTYGNLETLTYAHLGDWIRRQRDAVGEGVAGSDSRLQAANQLQARLKLILEGEPPYDIFVRWKPLSKQAIGWHPDLNDGARVNIRPFAAADILRKPVKVKWDKDRGNEPTRDKKDFPWFWGWDEKTQDFAGLGDEPDGNRWNDCHYTNEFKRKAREG